MARRWHYHNLNRHFWINAMRKVIPRVPRFVVSFARIVVVTICLFSLTNERRAIIANLRQITGKKWPALLVMTWQLLNNYAKQLVAFSIHDLYPEAFWKEQFDEGSFYQDKVKKSLQMGRGVILVSAHLGSWEMGKYILALKDTPVNMVMVPAETSHMEDYWNELRTIEGLKVIDLSSSPFASLEIIRALENNEIVVIHGDRVANNACVQADFFGKKAWFPKGPVELARLSGAPLMGTFILLNPRGGFQVVVDDSLQLQWTGNRAYDIQHNTQRFVDMLAHYIVQYPTQFYAFYDFWREPDKICIE